MHAGVYSYLEELWRKKQSETMRFLLRLRAWEYRQKQAIHRCPGPSRPDKARRLGYRAKQVRCCVKCISMTACADGVVSLGFFFFCVCDFMFCEIPCDKYCIWSFYFT